MTGTSPRPGAGPQLPISLAWPANLLGRLRRWRARRQASPVWTVGVALVLALILLPVATILVQALGSSGGLWSHLGAHVLARVIPTTALLMAGVGIATQAVGTAAAWLVTMYRFPGRAMVDRLLVLPLAVPTYIVAYCYVELLDYAGPLQTWMRAAFGWTSPRDYWFPEVRSLGGAILILSVVLYPYVYLSARASFV